MYFYRLVEKNIDKNLANNKAIIITGMRRIGKTTLMRHYFDQVKVNKIWFDFDNPLDTQYFESLDYNDVFINIVNKGNLDKNKKIHIFIDEAQFFPQISKIAKYLMDHYDIKFFLTGSSSYYLKNLFPESLAGRKIIFEMFPLNFAEFLIFKKINADQYNNIKNKNKKTLLDYEMFNKYYDDYYEWGGFPEVVLADNQEDKINLLNDIFASYFQNEVLKLADFHKNEKIRDLILLLAARVSSQLDIVKLSQELKITRATVYSYLSFLKDTYFIHLISPFSKSVDREISGTQKIYFCDNGILKIMAELNAGQKFENLVYNQLKFYGKINFFRKSTGAEIDFILNKKICYEAKTTATKSDFQNLLKSMKLAKLKEGYLISRNFTDALDDNLIFGEFL